MELKSERLIYREYQEQDLPLFYSVFSDEQVMKYALIDRYLSVEEILPFFHEVLENNRMKENRRNYELAVYLEEDQRFIGFADIEIQMKNSTGGCGEVGYFLLPQYWGKGYATEIANTLVEYCFRDIGLHRVTARCNANNRSSEHIMIKTGMRLEGEFRKVRFKNGRWENEKHYSILAEEWKQK